MEIMAVRGKARSAFVGFCGDPSLVDGPAPADLGLDDLRAEALGTILAILLGVAFLGVAGTGVVVARAGVAPAYFALTLAGLVLVARWARRLGPRLAAAILVAGLVGLAAATTVLGGPVPLAALGVPVLLATFLLGPAAGLATVLIGGWIVTMASLGQGFPVADALLLTYGVGGLVFICATVLWRALMIAATWAWASYAEARQKSDELRERQVELGRLNASLVLAYEQIKQTSAQLERARQAAEEARRLKAEFAASVSHELRTPLNLVIGLSELMVSPHPGAPALSEVYQADVEAIYRNACHISNLIDDVLDLSQIEAHHMGLLKERVELPSIVDAAVATVRTLFENTGLWLRVELPGDLPPLFVDPVRVRQILINLLGNAVRFTEEGGVTIRARGDGSQLVLEVADTGVGIAAADLPGVFQEFWRSGEPRRGKRGSGLGLAVSKRFAELHGGNMWVESRPGAGSSFFVALPLGEKALVEETDLARARWERLEREAPAQPSVVLVAPDPETRRVFGRYLDGFRVEIAPEPDSIAALLARTDARAIVADSASRRDAILRWLNAAPVPGGGLPVLTCALQTSRKIARGLGVQDYLVKPVSQEQLRRALSRLSHVPREVVVADDDPEMLHLLPRMLGALLPRAAVRVASDGWAVLDLIEARRPDVIILDLLMPGLDGYGVVERLKGSPERRAIPVLVVTARGAEDDGIVAGSLEISQAGGLRVGELCRWIHAGLNQA